MAKKVEAYKATDGELFETKLDAEIHEAQVEKDKCAQDWASSISYNGMDSQDVVEGMRDYKDKFIALAKATLKLEELLEKKK